MVRFARNLGPGSALRVVLGLALLASLLPLRARAESPVPSAETRPAATERDAQRERGPIQLTREQLEARTRGMVELPEEPATPFALRGIGPGGLDWQFSGPLHMQGEYWSGGGIVAGRVSCIAPHPFDPNIAYIAAAQGGVWKTTTGGTSWAPLTDQLSSLASGWIALDPSNPDVLWYGTGEQHSSFDGAIGDGIWRSPDGGASWSKRGTRTAIGSYVARVAVDYANPNTIFVASDLGFVRSTNGGTNWTVTLGTEWCNDLVQSPANPLVLYCALHGNGVYKSTDGGGSWSHLAGGLPASGFGRVNLAIAPSSASTVYASFISTAGSLLGLYVTTNDGATWSALPATPNYPGERGWYASSLVVDPAQPANVLAGGSYPYSGGGQGVIRSIDGGASWVDVTFGANGVTVHPDQHALAFGAGGMLWLANDGGVWKSPDLGTDWINCNAGLSIAQFYSLAATTAAPWNPLFTVGGTQDNGTVLSTFNPGWEVVFSGDGGPVAQQTGTPYEFISTGQGLTYLLHWSNGAFVEDLTGPWVGVDSVGFTVGPMIQDGVAEPALLVGTNRVWQYWQHTLGVWSWQPISGNLTNGGYLRSIATAGHSGAPPPPEPIGAYYVGSSDGALSVTMDHGLTWYRRDPPAGGAAIPSIVTVPTDENGAYACVDAPTGGRVFQTGSAGVSWTNITGNLPTNRSPKCLAADFDFYPPHLFLGTDAGVYVSHDNGTTWVKALNGLPNVEVDALVVQHIPFTVDRLLAATHGRGVWEAPLDHSGPAITLASPATGATWNVGDPVQVQWTATDASPPVSVDIKLSRDDGQTFPEVLASGIPNTGSFNWTVTGPPTLQALLLVLAHDNVGLQGFAENHFYVADPNAGVEGSTPTAFALGPVRSSPGREPFIFDVDVPYRAAVSVEVYDVTGARVAALAEGELAAGRHHVQWNGAGARGQGCAGGVYFARMSTPGMTFVRRLVLLK